MTTTTLPVIACTRCTTLLEITDHRVAAAERLYPFAVDPDQHRAYLAASCVASSGWEYDGGDSGLPYCERCVPIVERQRADAIECPAWCEDCQGYSLASATISHRKDWTGADGYRIGVLVQVVGDDDGDEGEKADPPWIELCTQDVTVADLLALQAAVPAMLAFLTEHGLGEAVTPA